ncbi:biotin transporter BioY [Anaerotignum lactatifermentans]|uniref:Biotin transporter n=1 Tax=Anaerotignum lactatifermentans TaxID=160404 RepID=A0ABS2GCE2_9FIRM|nr:biotin transporter BioY [Anaerotignum lactatifermentans]MBM6828591.1 biotin transporter BioY [Anaerotignum lactatifermentans]MBM6878537.1 biotin transporter BioY [Anaerotignum lactatifermentans]MBM6950173.1 biotin transporter BioY [Anaerotignum lactatifermentans]
MTKTQRLIYTALMTAVICIAAPISIPIPVSPVALTLSTFAIYLAVYVLDLPGAVAAVGLYLLLGAVGLPVFSGYTGGFSRFAAPGGGYLVGYLLLALIGGLFFRRWPTHRPIQALGLFLGTLATYALGTLWLAYVTNTSFWQALPMGALVFLPLDILKILCACWLGSRLRQHLKTHPLAQS